MVKRIKPAAAMIGAGLLVGLPVAAHAASISVNFAELGAAGNPQSSPDGNTVDTDETAVVGVSGAANVSGLYWNNVTLRANQGAGAANVFTANTQGGNFIALQDDSGSSAAKLTSSTGGSFYSNLTNYATNPELAGTTGLVQSWLGLGQSQGESITISGLSSDFTSTGYDVYLFFESGFTGRTFGFEVVEGPGGGNLDQQLWTKATAESNNSGTTVTWVEATNQTAPTTATTATNANYGVFTDLTADSFTINGLDPNGRALLNGIQIVSHSVAIPSPAALPAGLAMMGMLALRRRR